MVNRQPGLRNITLCAICIALCLVLPIAFHAVPNAGSIFLPMHIPVLLCGLICGWQYGLLCGALGPLLSSVLTGMPPMAMTPGMMVELAVYGLITGLVMRRVHTGKLLADLYCSLITAMLAGRILGGIVKALLFTNGGYPLAAWATASFITGLPGIAIQLALIPAIYFALEKARIVPARYTNTPTQQ